MADLDFSHRVAERPAGEQLPKQIQQTARAEVIQAPDFSRAASNYAEASNWMSSLGSYVATQASNKMAQQIGGELGKNPQGDIGVPLTDFDKTMQQSYQTQAHATLGLQADKLITDSNLAVAQASRVTPGLIAQSNKNISIGLQNIFKNAPQEIRPQLESTYGAAQLNQAEQLTKRMISEQHEDTRNNTILSNNRNAETAHALAASGKIKEAEALIKTTDKLNSSTVAANIGFTPQQGKVGTDTVRQSVISGRLQYEYEKAASEKKGEEYLKSLAKRPDWISDADYPSAMQNIRSYVSNQEALKSNYEQLVISDFQGRIATNAAGISGTELQSTLDKLSPINASKLNLDFIRGYKAQLKEQGDQNNLIQNWNDPREQANATEKNKNAVFNGKVAYAMKNKPGLSREDAEGQVAASAGGEIPVFTKTLKNGLWGGDAASMVATAKQIDTLQSNGNGHALSGLSLQDLALASDIKHNYNPADPASAARMIAENKQNQDPDFRKDSESAFATLLYNNTQKIGKDTDDYILQTFGMQGGMFHQGFDTPWSKSSYASDIKANWRNNFINTGRDNNRAIELTQNYIKNNYGKTSINGSSQWTLHPIEQACGFPEGEGISTINKDIQRQLIEPMSKMKNLYDEKKSDHYWTIEPVYGKEPSRGGLNPIGAFAFGKNLGEKITQNKDTKNAPIERLHFVKHSRNGVSTNKESYPLRLVGNNFNWDLNVETDHGPVSIFLAAPEIGVHTYTPDLNWIKDNGR